MQRQKKVIRIVEQRSEPILQVKPPRAFIDGVNFDSANSNLVRQTLNSLNRVQEQVLAQSVTLHPAIDRQSPDENDGHVKMRKSLAFIRRQVTRQHAVRT